MNGHTAPEPDSVVLARIDERTKVVEREVRELKGTLNRLDQHYPCREEFDSLVATVRELDGRSVTRREFAPVRALVFGAVGLVLTAVVIAVVALVVSTAPASAGVAAVEGVSP